jgi:hypothetical protein
MSSSTEIANMAISHLGTGKEISNLDTEKSEEASSCRRFFTNARDAVLKDCPWPFATEIATLGLIKENPNTEWDFSYRYPSDCLYVRKIQSGIRTDHRQSRVPYRVGQDASGLLIFTDEANAVLEYTKREEDSERFPSDFVLALSLKLAYHIAPRLSKGDPFKVKQELQKEYLQSIYMAKASALNEEQPDEEPESQFIRFRE